MKKYRLICLHLAFWLSFPFLLTFFKWLNQFTNVIAGAKNSIVPYSQVWRDNMEFNLAMMLIGAVSFYLTYLLVFPALTKSSKKIGGIFIYVLILLLVPFMLTALMSIFSFAVYFFFRYFLFVAYLVQIPFVLAAIAAGYLKNWFQSKQALALVERQAIKAELELLKSQINPHFLFNTINNIDTLILKDPPLASRYLNELADLFRFMLYEIKTEKISLSKEIAYIEKYVQLQKIRTLNPDFVSLTIKSEIGEQQIAPLIFIPLIENAFKHVSDKVSEAAIKIDFEAGRDWVLFTCWNKRKETGITTTVGDGWGLHIIRQRLNLLYQNRHHMTIKKDDNYYEVTLKLFLDAN